MPGVVFVEEISAEKVVDAIARRLGIRESLTIVPHEGKNDLERSFARKIPVWLHPNDLKFLVSRDNDGGDCQALKKRLQARIKDQFHQRTRFRIVMHSLENWYIGDLQALVEANLILSAKAEQQASKARFRDPDSLTNATQIFKELVGAHGKIEMAQALGRFLDPERSRSKSFKHFVHALSWAAQ